MHKDKVIKTSSGWPLLTLSILLLLAIVPAIMIAAHSDAPATWIVLAGLLLAAAILVMVGFFIVNPNQSVALLLFGSYKGTVRDDGFKWANPFFTKMKVSIRARNLNGEKLKVNDLSGNPIEIAAVVVWEVRDTAQALFQVDDFEHYVTTQSESAVRHLASSYSYDGEDEEVTLRRSTDEVNEHLQRELQDRLDRAGVNVIEARISHLAYAPEIAGAMLQRQQAHAVVAARQKIVQGAVGMVEMALQELNRGDLVELDEDKKASMVSNLLVVLCSEHAAHPVVNTGTLYQ